MCGRYSLFTPPDDIEERFGVTFSVEYEPRYNAAPGQQLPVVRDDDDEHVTEARWGLVPSWADEASTELINARSETVTEKPAFREAYRERRCLVLADGFYEWQSTGSGKQPYRLTLESEAPFAMAGLWEEWRPPQKQTGLSEFTDGSPDRSVEPLVTFTVLTREPTPFVRKYHHRMAVVLGPDEEAAWLDGVDVATIAGPTEELRAYPVSRAVNSPANDTPAVVEEVEPEVG